MKTGIEHHFSSSISCVDKKKNPISCVDKIPPYAKDYKKEYFFIKGLNKEFEYFINKLDNSSLLLNLKLYIEDVIIRLKNKSYEENWSKIIIYNLILNLLNFIKEYFNNPTKDRLKIVDWYFIDLIINKDKIIVRGFFYELGSFIEDKVLCEGLLELESRINKIEI